MPITRRKFLQSAVATLAGATLTSGCVSEKKTSADPGRLNIYGWADYLHPDTIPVFEKRYGIKVIYDTFSSNEALIAKIEAGAADYDIIYPTNYAVTKLAHLGRLQPIDRERLSNDKNILPRFANPKYDPGCRFSVPYTFGTTGIAYHKSAFKGASDLPTDWDVFWDKRLAGRITLLEDARETIGMALKHRGHSYNCIDDKLLHQACNDLKSQKPLVMCYTSDQVIIYLSSGDALASLAFSGDAHQAARGNPDVGYIIPASGASLWVDSMCIPAGAPHEANALKWIDYILEARTGANITNFTYYPVANGAAREFIEPALLSDKTLYPPEALMDKCDDIADIGLAMFTYDRLWTELKCT